MIWSLIFFPPTGERYSPFDFILDLPDKKVSGRMVQRLEKLQKLEYADWPPKWTKHIEDKIGQLRVGDYRLLYYLDGRIIVILHAFRKRRQQTNPKHIERAKIHYNDYISLKGG